MKSIPDGVEVVKELVPGFPSMFLEIYYKFDFGILVWKPLFSPIHKNSPFIVKFVVDDPTTFHNLVENQISLGIIVSFNNNQVLCIDFDLQTGL